MYILFHLVIKHAFFGLHKGYIHNVHLGVKYRFDFYSPKRKQKFFLKDYVEIKGRKYWKVPVIGEQS